MEDISQLEDGSMCYVKFKIKDMEECRKRMRLVLIKMQKHKL